ncbi:MAG: ATP-binding protein, partial [Pseudomonadales bacterium]
MKAIKNSAIIYSGYDYQTLHGVLLLAKWINNPTEYQRICFEADGDKDEAPQGIDDIICERSDGRIDYRQVKFTPSPFKEENKLSWDWLLKISGKTDRSRSILKKISDAVKRVPDGKIGDVILLTNKRPDRNIDKCLNEHRIIYENIDQSVLAEITDQLGDEKTVKAFFSILQIHHSDADYPSVERALRGELEPVSNNDGINRLLIRSRAWAIFKDMPSDGGWIHLHHIREILALDRPEPIPESFEIPEQYCLPDEEFHKNLLQQVISSTGELITITGDPGRGKSTYLSYLCQTLDDLDVPSIRHHYFLSTGDHTYDRLSSRVVGDSLLSQISNTYHEIGIDESRTENLRKVLKDCADYYKPKNKPFVIIIDGLDHVWRDNSGDKKPLDHIFKQLLPLPSNIVLIVGTQPVDDKLLPESLLKHSPRKNWYWLPAMTGNAIYEFVNYQVSSGRLRVNRREAAIDDEIKESAEKLTAITSGYPLHVIYSCEYLAQNGKPLSTWEVEKLPPCANSDIESYYLTLWNQLSNQQKDVLHLCCGFELTWPRHDLGVVLNDSPDYPPSINAVAHMLSESRSGVTPFHDSLVVFVTSQEEHDTRVAALTNDTCNWLDTKAQEHLKNEWYWSCLAKMGDIEPLQNGLTRDWVLDRLIEGYSIDTCIRLLTEAETITFRKLQFAKAYRHRELKMRLINGPKFQTWGSINLEALSNIYSPKELIDQKISSIRNHSAVKISTLSISLWCRGETDDSKMLSKYSLRRHRASSKLVNNKDRQETQTEAETIIKAGTLNDTLNYDAMFDDGNFKTWPEGYVKAFVDGCLLKKDIGLLVRAHQCLVDVGKSTKIENAIIRLSLIE